MIGVEELEDCKRCMNLRKFMFFIFIYPYVSIWQIQPVRSSHFKDVLGFSCAKDMNVHDDEWGVKKTLTVVIMSVQVFGLISTCENNL